MASLSLYNHLMKMILKRVMKVKGKRERREKRERERERERRSWNLKKAIFCEVFIGKKHLEKLEKRKEQGE